MNVLAIRFARLGDVVLLLPALSSLKRAFPDARLTFLTGHRCAAIARLCPAIDEVLAVDRVAMRDGPALTAIKNMARLVRDVRRRRYDLVIDFHSFRETNLLSWLSGTPVRIGMKRYQAAYLRFCFNRAPIPEDKALHVAEMFQKVVDGVLQSLGRDPSSSEAASLLVIPPELWRWADRASSNKLRLALYIDAPVVERVWPPERFAALADFAVEQLRATPIVISSRQGQHLAKRVVEASRNPDRLVVFTDVGIAQLAALIASARLLVSNDTGPMHIGPALGVPTLGLFSVGYPEHFRPVGLNDRYLRVNPIEEIEMEDVIVAVEEMWTTADPDLRC